MEPDQNSSAFYDGLSKEFEGHLTERVFEYLVADQDDCSDDTLLAMAEYYIANHNKYKYKNSPRIEKICREYERMKSTKTRKRFIEKHTARIGKLIVGREKKKKSRHDTAKSPNFDWLPWGSDRLGESYSESYQVWRRLTISALKARFSETEYKIVLLKHGRGWRGNRIAKKLGVNPSRVSRTLDRFDEVMNSSACPVSAFRPSAA